MTHAVNFLTHITGDENLASGDVVEVVDLMGGRKAGKIISISLPVKTKRRNAVNDALFLVTGVFKFGVDIKAGGKSAVLYARKPNSGFRNNIHRFVACCE